MGKLKLTGKQLREIGYPEGPVISIAMQVMEKNYKRNTPQHALSILQQVLQQPQHYLQDEVLGKIAVELIAMQKKKEQQVDLNAEGIHYNVFGGAFIEEGALTQMNNAVRLPISVAGALMPDAHQGYGLPIGGVLATENAVIPYGVGVDIGCRMCLSIFEMRPNGTRKQGRLFYPGAK